jgi:outer membrane protein TolC
MFTSHATARVCFILLLSATNIYSADQKVVSRFDTLSLEQCFELCRQNNPSLKAALAQLELTRGEKISAISRLLPHLDLIFRNNNSSLKDSSGSITNSSDQAMELILRQRIAEFGPSTYDAWARKQRERDALLASEDTAATVLSAIRKTYFTLQIMKEQILQHDSLLGLYTLKLEKENSRLSSGIGRKNAVLTARLNIVDEKERILSLESRMHTMRATLKQLCGLPSTDVPAVLPSDLLKISLGEDSCVAQAMDNNSRIAQLRFEVEIYKRQLLQAGWNFAPGISLNAGVRNGAVAGGLQLSSNRFDSERRWSLDAVGSSTFFQSDSAFVSPDSFFSADRNLRYTVGLTVDLPIFRGLREVGELKEAGARYNKARNELLVTVRAFETALRSTWFEYQRSSRQLDLSRERVEIAQERYSMAETLLEMEKMSEEGYDNFRVQLFDAQDNFFGQQFQVLEAGENLRLLIRRFE